MNTLNQLRLFWDGNLRNFDTESKELEGIESYIDIYSADQKRVPAVIGKVFDKDIKKVEIVNIDDETSEYIPLKMEHDFWYYFYEGEAESIEIYYIK